MALNNASGVSSNKRNLKRLNRLPGGGGGDAASFDNAAFEADDDKTEISPAAKHTGDADHLVFLVEESYPQRERINNVDDVQPFTQRRLLPVNLTNQTVNNTKHHTRSTNSSQNVPEYESIELTTKNDNSAQENRKVLGSINLDEASLNNINVESKDGDDTDSKITKTMKATKMTFNVNLKRFEATTTITADATNAKEDQDKFKLTRQVKTEDLTTTRRGSANIYSTVVAAARFSRTYSTRKRPPRLLRDLSFSDADDSDTKDYGSLKKLNLPRRLEKVPMVADTVGNLESLIHEIGNLSFELLNLEPVLSSFPEPLSVDTVTILESMTRELRILNFELLNIEYSLSSFSISDPPGLDSVAILEPVMPDLTNLTSELFNFEPVLSSFLGPLSVDTVRVMESLIHELIARGKIYQVAVLDLEDSEVLASVPSGMLSRTDALGMTKSIICQSSLFRLQIGNVDYSCFKHRQDAVQGRTEDLVMVMQTTKTCVVAGFSHDDAPGSCNSEVNEFAKVLEGAGW